MSELAWYRSRTGKVHIGEIGDIWKVVNAGGFVELNVSPAKMLCGSPLKSPEHLGLTVSQGWGDCSEYDLFCINCALRAGYSITQSKIYSSPKGVFGSDGVCQDWTVYYTLIME